jgi:FHS family Na+ dependent glucose MFS transporter 1
MSAVLLLPVAFYILVLPSPTHQDHPGQPAAALPLSPPILLYKISLLILLAAGIESSLSSWIFPYVVKTNVGTNVQASYITSAFWATLTIGRLIGIPLSIRFPARLIILSGLIAVFIAITALAISSTNLPLLSAAIVGLGLALGPMVPNMISLSERMGFSSGSTTGVQLIALGAGGLIFPVVISQFFETPGPQALMYTLLACGILSLLVFSILRLPAPRSPSLNERIPE